MNSSSFRTIIVYYFLLNAAIILNTETQGIPTINNSSTLYSFFILDYKSTSFLSLPHTAVTYIAARHNFMLHVFNTFSNTDDTKEPIIPASSSKYYSRV